MSTLPQATIERIEKNAETWGVSTLQNFAYKEGAQSEALRNLENEREILAFKVLKEAFNGLKLIYNQEKLENEQEIQRLMGERNTLALEKVEIEGAFEEINHTLGETKTINNSYADKIVRMNKRIKELELSLKQLIPMAKEYYERISKKSLGHQEFVRDDLDDITNAESILSQPSQNKEALIWKIKIQ